MTEPRPDDGMIEIGDVEAEPTAEPPLPPQVVIEYRDRGVPWMLVPPLLALVAVVAGVSAYNYTTGLKSRRLVPLALAPEPVGPLTTEFPAEPPSEPPRTIGRPEEPPEPAPPAKPIENPAPPVVQAPAPTAHLTASEIPADPLMMLAEATELPKKSEVPPTPRVTGVGFDPKAFETPGLAESLDPGSPTGGQNLAPTSRTDPGDHSELVSPPTDQPEVVDPDLLPPDPRQARAARQRRAAETRIRTEQERFEFHAKLNAIYKQYGTKSGPVVRELCRAFGQDVPPAAKDQAMQALGRTGQFAGINRKGRISLLRKLGFPEPSILGDIFDMESRHESPEARNSPSRESLYLHSIRILLQHPPGRPGGTSRPIPLPANHGSSQPATNPAVGIDPADLDP